MAEEKEDGENWSVFHAMLLTPRRAQAVFTLSGGLIDLCNELVPQRPLIGPQYGKGC
jgi:hypothetical protein